MIDIASGEVADRSLTPRATGQRAGGGCAWAAGGFKGGKARLHANITQSLRDGRL